MIPEKKNITILAVLVFGSRTHSALLLLDGAAPQPHAGEPAVGRKEWIPQNKQREFMHSLYAALTLRVTDRDGVLRCVWLTEPSVLMDRVAASPLKSLTMS